jgi:Tol biopolymer transport system component
MRIIGLGIVAALLLAGTATAQTAEALLGAALHEERVTGNLQAAIGGYRKALAAKGVSRQVAAQAQYHIGLCYERLGNQEARKAFEAVVKNYGDQKQIVEQARARLAAMGGGGAVLTRELKLNSAQSCFPWNVSLDGRLMGATEYATGNMAVIDAATGACQVLTNYGQWNQKNGFVDQGAISRDGKWLAAWHYDGGMGGGIRVAGTDGAGERTVYVRRKLQRAEWGMPNDWSPDGTTLLVQFEHETEQRQGTTEFAAVSVADGSVRVLKTFEYTSRYRPKFLYSPDGKYVAWDYPPSAGSMDGDLTVMPSGGGSEIRVAASPGHDKLFGWTADGHILFLSNRTGRNGLYLVRMRNGAQAGEPVELRANLPGISPVGIASNGTLFYSEDVRVGNVMSADFDLAGGKAASAPAPVAARYPNSTEASAWSADGRFSAVQRLTADLDRTVFLIHDTAAGTMREISTPFRRHMRARVTWSPDNRFLLTSGDTPGATGIFRVDVATGESRLLGQGGGVYLEWSRDGRHLYKAGGATRNQILQEDTQTGQVRTVYEHDKLVRRFALSLDGKLLAFVSGGWSDKEPCPLLVLDLASGQVRKIDEGMYSHTPAHMAWTPDGKALVALRSDGQAQTLWAANADGSGARQLDVRLGRSNIDNIEVHPNGRTVAWTVSRFDRSWWSMENLLPVQR